MWYTTNMAHRLTHIDTTAGRGKLTGTCEVCGPVKVYRKGADRYECAARRYTPSQNPRHLLTDVDPDARTATCALCGPVKVHRGGKNGDRVRYVCAQKWEGRQSSRYRSYAKADRCANCQYLAPDPCVLDVHHVDENHGNNDHANLTTLCVVCHRLWHRRRDLYHAATKSP